MPIAPKSKEEAIMWAEKRGLCWYAETSCGRARVYRSTGQSLKRKGDDCVASGNSWSKTEARDVVQALNEAFALGRQFERSQDSKLKDLSPAEKIRILSQKQ